MKRNLARKSVVLGAGGMLAAGLLSTAATAASAATSAAAQARGPAWRTVLSVANGTKTGLFDTVVATGTTSGGVPERRHRLHAHGRCHVAKGRVPRPGWRG
jgi:hypothetical protein